MVDVEATFAVLPSVLTGPILSGEVSPRGIRLQIREAKSMDALSRSMLNLEYDIAEMSIATYTKSQEQGLPLTALPLFTSGRRFTQAGLHFATHSGLSDPSQLRGRTVATGQYWLSAAIWQRQFLQETYGIAPQEMSWVTLAPERLDALRIPAGVNHRMDATGRSVRELAAAGEIDATLNPGAKLPSGEADPLVPAFPDPIRAQRDYYRRTGVFPIVHVTVVKKDLVDRCPEVVDSVCAAYLRARDLARSTNGHEASESSRGGEVTKELLAVIGSDPWVYGITPNRKALEAFVETAHTQQLVGRRFRVEELFAANLPAALQ